ncbi:MAG: acetyl/propionyl/methylcrotonyl-CoA carboxylase subunit alpha [Bacteroidota bacterium]
MKRIQKLLIANRGEIAVRIINTTQKMGIQTVAIYAENDRSSYHVARADEAYSLGHGVLQDTYLNLGKIEAVIKQSGADAVHPGYGFLSENPAFPELCERLNVLFVGPHADAIRTMGDKIASRKVAEAAGVAITKGITGSPKEILEQKDALDYPVLVKASAGGGGKGMRVVFQPENLQNTLQTTAREAKSYFGNDTVYVEHYFQDPRHIEVQVLADHHNNYVHLFERECSLQRRHQKVIEEAPSMTIDPKLRQKLTESALKLARKIDYVSAGTVEFLVDRQNQFFFLEMNTRIQVEHPVTEKITGVDIVQEQIRIAQGDPLSFQQKELKINGHAIQARLYAEDPLNNYRPAPGFLHTIAFPINVDIRIDHGLHYQDFIAPDYDPMIAKVIAHDQTRPATLAKLSAYLKEITIVGSQTNQEFLLEVLNNKDFLDNNISTQFLERNTDALIQQLLKKRNSISSAFLVAAFVVSEMEQCKQNNHGEVWNQIGFWRIRNRMPVAMDGKVYQVAIKQKGKDYHLQIEDALISACCVDYHNDQCIIRLNNVEQKFRLVKQNKVEAVLKHNGYYFRLQRMDIIKQHDQEAFFQEKVTSQRQVVSPVHGRVVSVAVARGATVKAGETLVVIESMKIENNIVAETDAEVEVVKIEEGEQVTDGQVLISMKQEKSELQKEHDNK